MIYVVSTGNAPAAREKCILSVRNQTGVNVKHIVLDAAEQRPARGPMLNLAEAVHDLPDDAVIARVDLDDWLAIPTALQTVARLHAAGAWATYGSFVLADGRGASWVQAYKPGESVRTSPWRATHLKTYRAGLFKRIKTEDLMMNDAPIEHARDMSEMFPIVEMAGTRAVHCPEILYVYNLAASFEFSASLEDLAYEKRCVAHVRSLPPYAALEEL